VASHQKLCGFYASYKGINPDAATVGEVWSLTLEVDGVLFFSFPDLSSGGVNMADVQQTVGFLARVPLFQGLKKRQLERLARHFVERDYASGEAIVTQDKGGEGIFILVSGGAEAIRERADDTKAVVNTFGPTDFFGELALLDDGLRTASVVTTEATRCLVLTRWAFLGVLKEDADMGVVIAQELAKRFRMALEVL